MKRVEISQKKEQITYKYKKAFIAFMAGMITIPSSGIIVQAAETAGGNTAAVQAVEIVDDETEEVSVPEYTDEAEIGDTAAQKAEECSEIEETSVPEYTATISNSNTATSSDWKKNAKGQWVYTGQFTGNEEYAFFGYFDSSGWHTSTISNVYYIDSNGVVQTGWHQYKGKWHYYDNFH